MFVRWAFNYGGCEEETRTLARRGTSGFTLLGMYGTYDYNDDGCEWRLTCQSGTKALVELTHLNTEANNDYVRVCECARPPRRLAPAVPHLAWASA